MNQKNMERDLLQQEYDSNESQLDQLKHQQERLENRIAYYEKGERKKRTHRLCTIAGTLESIAPGIKELTLPEVIELLEHIFSDTEVKRMVHKLARSGHEIRFPKEKAVVRFSGTSV